MLDLIRNIADGLQYIIHLAANVVSNFGTLLTFVGSSSSYITGFFSGFPAWCTLVIGLLGTLGVLSKVTKWR